MENTEKAYERVTFIHPSAKVWIFQSKYDEER